MSVTHIAGIVVKVDGRIIQRCGLCGEKLVDSLGCVTSDGSEMPTWKEHTFIHIDGNYCEAREPTQQLPEDNCLPLVEF